MSEEKQDQQSSGLGIDGADREAEFSRLESEVMGGQPVDGNQVGQEQPSAAEIIQPILEMGFMVLAPNWQVSGVECRELSKAYGALVDKYFPDGIGNYGVEVGALMITAGVILPRMKLPRKVEVSEQEADKRGGDNEQ